MRRSVGKSQNESNLTPPLSGYPELVGRILKGRFYTLGPAPDTDVLCVTSRSWAHYDAASQDRLPRLLELHIGSDKSGLPSECYSTSQVHGNMNYVRWSMCCSELEKGGSRVADKQP